MEPYDARPGTDVQFIPDSPTITTPRRIPEHAEGTFDGAFGLPMPFEDDTISPGVLQLNTDFRPNDHVSTDTLVSEQLLPRG